LACAARRAGRIVLSFAQFNVLMLVSRTSNGFPGLFLAKRIETALASDGSDALIWVSLSRLVGNLLAQALLVPAALLTAYTAPVV
jgi:hypothetical protein